MKIFRTLFKPKRMPVQDVRHPSLGTLMFSADAEAWQVSVATGTSTVILSVVGEYEPEPAALARAANLPAELPALLAQLPRLLEDSAARIPEIASDIRALTLDEIVVSGPDVNKAMVWLSGPHAPGDEWHCVWDGQRLTDLGFDG